MPQSLTRLPQEADFKILGWEVIIQDHEMKNWNGIFDIIINIVNDSGSQRDTLYQFEKHGISFEMAIERCVQELEYSVEILARIIAWDSFIKDIAEKVEKISGSKCTSGCISLRKFSESVEGRATVDQLVEKIRSCNNWGELYDEMHQDSQFNKDIESRIIMELKEQCRKV